MRLKRRNYKELGGVAKNVKKEHGKIFDKKIHHLRLKYREKRKENEGKRYQKR